MTRLIDAQDAFNVLSDYYHHSTHVQHLALQEALNKVPTIDAEPVRHGKWIETEFLKLRECSCCHVRWGMYDTENFIYCPECGARMDKDD